MNLRPTRTVLLTSLTLLVAQPSIAQPDREQGDRPSAREMIQQRLDRVREQEARLEEALTLLDDGTNPEDIRELLAPDQPFGQGSRGRAQHEGDRRPGGPAGAQRWGSPPDQEGQRPEPPTEEELLDVLSDLDPETADRLEIALERAPRRAQVQLDRMGRRLGELVHLKKQDIDAYTSRIAMHKANRDVMKSSRALLKAQQDDVPDEHLEALRAELLDAISRRVDGEISEREQMLAKLESRIASMRTTINELRENRNQVIVEQMEKTLQRIADGKLPHDPERRGDRTPPRR